MRINPRKNVALLASLGLLLLALSSCGLIYKQNIQQGNALEQEDLDQLYVGMNKRQVLFVLGSPSIHDPFTQDRWDYVQTFSRRGGPLVQRTVTLRFENDLLAVIEGAEDPKGTSDKTQDSPVAAAGTTAADPQEAAVESASEEAMEPVIKGLGERTAEDRKLEEGYKAMDQRNADDTTSPDIDG